MADWPLIGLLKYSAPARRNSRGSFLLAGNEQRWILRGHFNAFGRRQAAEPKRNQKTSFSEEREKAPITARRK